MLRIYVTGVCQHNDSLKPGAYYVAVYNDGSLVYENGDSEFQTTNNVQLILGVNDALRHCYDFENVEIYTNSTYLRAVLLHPKHAQKNLEELKPVWKKLKTVPKLQVKYINEKDKVLSHITSKAKHLMNDALVSQLA